jgi:GT2 family glycosyltransferase/glycosyltransferase involved in cell wall biosynthesis
VKSIAETQTAICIAGAHRSGTSMVTRLLHCCGLALGPQSELMPPQADNPEGFWEHLGFVALNDQLLSELGGAWDLPPGTNEDLTSARLDPLRLKGRLLIEKFDSANVWGWKDPRNSLTLPFWQQLLPGVKTLIVVRNPLEVAHSMRERNGTSYSFGLRLWEIYNRRLIQAATKAQRLVTHYDLFFDNPERELRRVANFAGLPDAKIRSAAKLVATRRRHTHFTVDQLIDAGVAEGVIELYRTLVAEASGKARRASVAKSRRAAGSDEAALLPGGVSRLNAFVPERIAQIEHLYGELLAQTEERHKTQIEELTTHLAKTEAAHKAQVEELTSYLAKTEAQHKAQVEETNARYGTETETLKLQIARQEGHYTAELETLRDQFAQANARHQAEAEHLRDRITQLNRLLNHRSVNLAEDERYIGELTDRLRKQLWNTRRLSRLLEDAEKASAQLRASRRWKLANAGATLKAKLSHGKVSGGYGHLEKVVNAYAQWRSKHPEIGKIDQEIKETQVPRLPRTPLVDTEQEVTSSDNNNKAGRVDSTPRNKASKTAGSPAPSLPLTSLRFPAHHDVEVSVIIPVFDQLSFTHACLASLQAVQEQLPFEVIIVDDCSTDATAKVVPQIPGVVYLRNDTNSGFIVSCNVGAEKARGKYLVFLNNDTVVKPGWLTALLDTFVEEPGAGIVGSKLLYPDGRLQEAGGIIWRDASGWNYGKFDDPEKPEYNYLREVDYCSAAALMVPKALFESVGRFDLRYAPGYYEDTDLAFKIRRTGYKVLYQPLSQVIHCEGATGGTDLSTGAKKHQAINRSTFAEAWADELIKKPVNGDVASLREPPPGRQNILVIDHHLPMPDRDSGSLRMFQLLKLLHELGHRVTFMPDNLADIPPYTSELQKRGIKVMHHPYVKKLRDYLIEHGSEFDVVVLSRCQFASKHIADVRRYAPQSYVIFDTVDLHFLREESEARLTGDPEVGRKARETKQQEHELIEQSDETWVVSNTEQQLLREKWPEKSIQLVSNIVDVPGSNTPFALRRDWLFIGGFQHPPNIDAVLFFLKEIYPLVSERLGDAKFYIRGDKAPPEIVALATEKIIVAGLQRDVRPFFESVRLSVAPLRFGAGVKGKINQSMAFGVPVVATSVAVEGTELRDREDILLADDPEDFARCLVELYESEELWNRLSENGIRKTRALYSVEVAREKLKLLFSEEHLKRLGTVPLVPEQELVVTATG